MTNDEVKAFWLKHGKKPRVQYYDGHPGWHIATSPTWDPYLEYRIHPDDINLKEYTNMCEPVNEPTTPVKSLDFTKPVQTRDGRAVRILDANTKNPRYPVVGMVIDALGEEEVATWRVDGTFNAAIGSVSQDLVQKPPQVVSVDEPLSAEQRCMKLTPLPAPDTWALAYLKTCDASVRVRCFIEIEVVRKLAQDLIAAGFTITVDDGGDDEPVKRSSDVQEILEAVFAVEEAVLYAALYVHDCKPGKPFAWVRLICGNDGWNVIADYSTNLEPHLKEVDAFIDAMQEWC